MTAACAVVRRELFDTLGGFDEQLKVAYNDIDLCPAANERGYYNVIVNRPLVHHFESASRGDYLYPEQEAEDRESLRYVLEKWGEACAPIPSTTRTLRSIGRTTRSRIRPGCPRSGPCGSPLPRSADRLEKTGSAASQRLPHLASSGDREASTLRRRPISASLQAGEQR